MSIEKVPGTDLKYYLITFDAEGRERTNDPDGLMSRRALGAMTPEITDVFLISHGWKGDIPAARDQYNRWIVAMASCEADIQHLRQSRSFIPLVIGLHWPSQPWGDEELGGGTGAFDVSATTLPSVEEMIDQYAERIAETPAAREALRTIFESARQDVAPATLPPEVRAAYGVLDREASLGNAGEGGGPWRRSRAVRSRALVPGRKGGGVGKLRRLHLRRPAVAVAAALILENERAGPQVR